MMRNSKGKIARRCAAWLTLLAVAACSLTVLVEGQQNVSAQQNAQEQYQAQLQNHYSQHGHPPIGNVEALFALAR
jgi:type II secretory pathway pseudopilin PulG